VLMAYLYQVCISIMMLSVVVGKGADSFLLKSASNILPSYIIDCANCADPHRFFPKLDLEHMEQVYVTEVEMLYKFRDVLKASNIFIKENRIRLLVITTTDYLFNYQDELENYYVTEHAWKLMRKIDIQVLVGVRRNSIHYNLAKRYAEEWVIL